MGRPMTFLHRTWTARSPSGDLDQSPQSGFYYLSLTVLMLDTSHVLLTLCSVGLSLYLQSRFLYTFDNQIIYVIKKKIHTHKKYIYIPVCCRFQNKFVNGQVVNFCTLDFSVGFLEECILLALLNPLVNVYTGTFCLCKDILKCF